eukprot:m.762485 g.762485  ORF g.762485 m.762485 type:complete len:729 (-) comp23209_c0_seq16:458-2644(-)
MDEAIDAETTFDVGGCLRVRRTENNDAVSLSLIYQGISVGLSRPNSGTLESTLQRLSISLTKKLHPSLSKKRRAKNAVLSTPSIHDIIQCTLVTRLSGDKVDGALCNAEAWLPACDLIIKHAAFNDQPETTTGMRIVCNPPTCLSVEVAKLPMSGVLQLAVATTEFADVTQCVWECAVVDAPQARTEGATAELVSTGVGATFVFKVPEASVGKLLRVTCTPTAQWVVGGRGTPSADADCAQPELYALETDDKDSRVNMVGTVELPSTSTRHVRCVGVPIATVVGPVVACPVRPWVTGTEWHGTDVLSSCAANTPTATRVDATVDDAAAPGGAMAGPRPAADDAREACVIDVMTYNILADCYATSPHGRQRLFAYCPDYYLQRDYREQLLVAEISARDCDVVCLQEVETHEFERFLRPTMEVYGYTGVLAPKHSELIEGCAIFAKQRSVAVVDSRVVVFREALREDKYAYLREAYADTPDFERIFLVGSVGQLVHLETPEGDDILVANTHLFYHPFCPHVRNIQMAILLQEATDWMAAIGPATSIVVCGDLNSTPETGVVEFLCTGQLSPQHPEWARGAQVRWDRATKSLVNLKNDVDGLAKPGETANEHGQRRGNLPVRWTTTTPDLAAKCKHADRAADKHTATGPALSHLLNLQLSHAISTMEKHSTNYTSGFCGWLDYLAVGGRLSLVASQDPIPEDLLQRDVALPSQHFPSDHVPVVARCVLRPQ